jgi:hypothetical protein
MIEHFGSESSAIEAIKRSQELRRTAARLTRAPVHEVNTLARDWGAYAEAIIDLVERR